MDNNFKIVKKEKTMQKSAMSVIQNLDGRSNKFVYKRNKYFKFPTKDF